MNPKRVIDLLHTEIRGLHEAAYLLAFFTLGSQIFALIRDRLLAHSFGAGETLDIFYTAFRIPDTLYALLASTVSLFVLIPFIERAERSGKEELRAFLSNVFSFFFVTLIVLASVLWLFAPAFISLFYHGFTPATQEQIVMLTRILLLQPLLLGVSNLLAAYVQVKGRFLLYAVAPILYNLGIIIGILFLYPFLGIAGLGWGVVLGAVFHLGVQVPFILQNKMLPKFVFPDWRVILEVTRISLPRSLTLSTQQLLSLFMVSTISLYAVGSVSSFSFAWNLHTVPLSLIGVSYSVAAFPKLARLFSSGKVQEYRNLVLVAARQIIFWALPAVVFVIVLRAQIVRVVLGSGQFDWDATRMTAAVLALLVVSLVAQAIIILLVRACYAEGKTTAPLIINISSAVFTVVLTMLMLHLASKGILSLKEFALLMKVEGVLSSEVLLVAFAYSLGMTVNALVLLGYFEYRYQSFLRGLGTTFFQSLAASLVAGFGTYLALNLLNDIVSMRTLIGVLSHGALSGLIGICFWFATLVSLGNKDIIAAWHALHTRVVRWRARGMPNASEVL